jgi:serine/threonine protein kinase
MSLSEQPSGSRQRELFLKALEKSTPAERAAFLDGACGGDAALRAAVEILLADHREDSFLEQPALAVTGSSTVRIATPNDEQVGTLIGRYKLLEPLGEGGFGAVWLAEQKEPVRRKVALKVIKLGMDTRQVVARFEAERQALALMDHPNIAKVLDAGTTDAGRPYFAMELVRGIPITKFCDENKLPTRERLDLFIKVCHAVQHAHQKGIIHRDLKPSNVLVTLHDGVPVPKVIDFGIAKATQQELTDKTLHTMFQQFIGTPAYVSPEQAEMSGLDIDTRTDIYSLGVLLYELLTGVTPFDAHQLVQSGLDEMRRIIREDEPQRPSNRLSTLEMVAATTLARHRREKLPALVNLVRGDLDWIVMKCLEKDRTRRYETASGLAADLKRHLGNEPILARPPSAAYRFRKAYRRNRIAFTAAACVLAAMVISLIGIWVSARRALQAQVHESIQRNLAEHRQRQAEAARQLAEANERKAKDEADRSTQAAKFIQSILTGLDLAATEGRDNTLLFDILMRALRRAEIELNNQPEVQIEVVSAISQCLDRLGLASHAYEVATRAMVLGKGAFGDEAPRTAELMTAAAARAIRHDKVADAASLATRALAILRRAHGNEHPGTLAAMRELGHAYVLTGRAAEAEPLLREHLKVAERVLPKDDEAHWISRIFLARALTDLGRVGEAEPLLREATSGYERVRGFSSRRVTATAQALCENLFQQRKLADAEAIARSWVTRLREARMNHPEAMQLTLLFGRILSEAGKDAEAGEVLREAFEMARGKKLPVTSEIMRELDRWCRQHGQVSEAEDLPRLARERPPFRPTNGSAGFVASLLSFETRLRVDNTDANAALNLATRQAWLGRTNDWRATSRRILERLADANHPASIERAAKSAAFAPGADRDLLDQADRLARRALGSSRESLLLPFFQQTVGMVEYRRGNFAAAEAILAEIKDDNSFRGVKAAQFYRAMTAIRESRFDDARRFLAAGEAGMLSLPVDDSAPLDFGGDYDDLINWLAYKEALGMLDATK